MEQFQPAFEQKAYLAGYRIPPLTFGRTAKLPAVLAPVWETLRGGDVRDALSATRSALDAGGCTAGERAALLAAQAHAHLRLGRLPAAFDAAMASRQAFPDQWLAYRVLLQVLHGQQRYQEAHAETTAFTPPDAPAAWDAPLAASDRHLAAASFAWLVKDWEAVFTGLAAAFPDGVATMPEALQEDWFRLAFYRDARGDAAEAAGQLIASCSTETADVLLQTLVMQGWHGEALTHYRTLYARNGASELLRRRLVGLCIREGDLQEARKLMESGALRVSI